MASDPYEAVVQALTLQGKRSGTGFKCPAHDDKRPSLRVNRGDDGRVLIHCLAGCSVDDVMRALGLQTGDLFAKEKEPEQRHVVARYDYVDERGTPLFQVQRFSNKDFSQSKYRGDVLEVGLGLTRKVPYRLPQVLRAVAEGRTTYICEGEKDVEAVEKAGGVATCNQGGAGNTAIWKHFVGYFTNADVVVVADKDEPGRAHAQGVAERLEPVAKHVRVVEALKGKDAWDHLELYGYTLDQLVATESALQAFSLASALDAAIEMQQRRVSGEVGISYGVAKLDELLLGMQPGQLVVIAARTAMGKSALAIQLAHGAANGGVPSIFFSVEMSAVEVANRVLLAESGIVPVYGDAPDFKVVKMFADFCEVRERHADTPLYVIDSENSSVGEIRDWAKRCRGLGLIVVDYLQLMSNAGSRSRTEEVSAISRSLKLLAKDLNVPIVALSQLNRAFATRQDKRPQLSDLRESGSIEQDADVVVFIHTDEDFRGELIVAKNRNGRVGIVPITFLGERTIFQEREARVG